MRMRLNGESGVMQPDNRTFTVYLRGLGENDMAFQVPGPDGLPIEWSLDAMLVRGVQLQQIRRASEPFTGMAPEFETDLRGFKPTVEKKSQPLGYFGRE